MSSRQCVRVSVGMWSSLGSPQLQDITVTRILSGENQTLEESSCHFNRTCPRTNYLTSTPPPPSIPSLIGSRESSGDLKS